MATIDKDIMGMSAEDMVDEIMTLRAQTGALVAALEKAKDTIRIWNGMGLNIAEEKACWNSYQSSPEMKQINAALTAASPKRYESWLAKGEK